MFLQKIETKPRLRKDLFNKRVLGFGDIIFFPLSKHNCSEGLLYLWTAKLAGIIRWPYTEVILDTFCSIKNEEIMIFNSAIIFICFIVWTVFHSQKILLGINVTCVKPLRHWLKDALLTILNLNQLSKYLITCNVCFILRVEQTIKL